MRKNALLASLFAVTVALTGCGFPKYANKRQIVNYVKDNIPEDAECVEELEDHVFRFESEDRDLEFDVWSTPGSINIDGAKLVYTNEYYIWSNYEDCVYLFYEDEIEDLMDDYDLQVEEESETMDCIKNFTFVIDNTLGDSDIERVNAFLGELRDIARTEREFEGSDFEMEFLIEILWWDDESDHYIRTAGNTNYKNRITADSTDEDIDIRNLRVTTQYLSNAIPQIYDGVLIEVMP